MIKKIIFFLDQTLSQRNYDRFGFDILKSNGFEVSVLDFTPYLCPDLYKWEIVNEKQVEFEEIFLIHDPETAIDKISNISSDTLAIVLLSFDSKTAFIFRALSERNAKYAVSISDAFPSLSKSGNHMLYYRELLKRCIFHPREFSMKVADKLKHYKLKYATEEIKGATLVLAGGAESINQYHYPMDENTEILWLHQLDYDNYLREVALPAREEDKAVLLDVCMLHHSDALAMNVRYEVDWGVYYSNLNKLFDLVERDLGLKVEIAAHPRSAYNDQNNPFGKRPVRKFETARAVKEAKLVIADQSTAINYAVLFNKPVIFIVSNEMGDAGDVINRNVRTLAAWLGKDVINIDNIKTIDWNKELRINQDRYDKYKYSYIKTPKSPMLPYWQIVADRLKEM